MRIVTEFAHAIHEIKHIDVPMPDGARLGARIWMPESAEDAPVPAILEYIPYRKNDLCAPEDRRHGHYLAGNGYAYVRLDLRGAGDSEGLLLDEYLPQELQDGFDAVQWIADQPWCDGKVGMIGISWGGFNGLQVAAMQPPALKAVVTVCSTDDRYADDVHYMGGCLLLDNLSWASQMLARNSLPPDPRNRGEAWREIWKQRLAGSGLWLKNWLAHQTRDGFWKHGSICEDYSDIQIPVYAVSGWADGYCRSVFRLVENLTGPRKGLIGPWAHKYPHEGVPGPAIGFMQECLRWWDYWLKGRETGIMDEPMMRLYMQYPAPPRGWYGERAGRWIAEPSWPSPNVTRTAYGLTADGRLERGRAESHGGVRAIRSPLTVGFGAGKWCSYASPGDQPVDQHFDDGGSLVFETPPLDETLEIVGDAALNLRVSSDQPAATVSVRLVEVAPDGTATRVAYGVFNLTHQNGHETPEALVPGEVYDIRVPFKPVAQRFDKGHRIRLSLSPSYFPMIWPSPEPVTLTVHVGRTTLELPVRDPAATQDDGDLRAFDEPEAGPSPEIERLAGSNAGWRLVNDLGSGRTTIEVRDGSGCYRLMEDDITVTKLGEECFSVTNNELESVTGWTCWRMGLARGDWDISTKSETTLTADRENFHVRARLRAWEGKELVHDQIWDEAIPRHLV